MSEENDVGLFMYQFHFENVEGHQDKIRRCLMSGVYPIWVCPSLMTPA